MRVDGVIMLLGKATRVKGLRRVVDKLLKLPWSHAANGTLPLLMTV